MTIGIMGAMTEEISSIVANMKITAREVIADREFISGSFNGQKCVTVFSRWGKVASAITATILFDHFHVASIIFSGVAGSVSDDITIGDIVISHKLYQHDMNAEPLFKKFMIPLRDKIDFIPDETLTNIALASAEKFVLDLQKPTHQLHSALSKFDITQPKALTRCIASGDQFVTKALSHEIVANRADTAAVEMEGAAVAQVCDEFDKPFVIIRTISDNANEQAPIDFMAFVTEIAKNYTLGILTGITDALNRELKRAEKGCILSKPRTN